MTPEQAEEIKKQLLAQIDSSKMENKEQIKKHVENLDEEQLEEFLKQNNIQFSSDSDSEPKLSSPAPKCIFCSIII